MEYFNKTKNDCLLKEIIKYQADIDILDVNGWTPLHKACEYENSGELVRFLLRNNANMFKFSNKKNFPIHIAALNDNVEAIESMLEFAGEQKDYLLEVFFFKFRIV